MKLPIQSTCKC